jgi:hypothetical protein
MLPRSSRCWSASFAPGVHFETNSDLCATAYCAAGPHSLSRAIVGWISYDFEATLPNGEKGRGMGCRLEFEAGPVLRLLRGPSGARSPPSWKSTGWQPHSVCSTATSRSRTPSRSSGMRLHDINKLFPSGQALPRTPPLLSPKRTRLRQRELRSAAVLIVNNLTFARRARISI